MSPLAAAARFFLAYGIGVAAALLFVRGIGRPLRWRFALLFALIPILFLRQGVFENRAPFGADQAYLTPPPPSLPGLRASAWMDDVVRQIFPWSVAVRRAWISGELPLRDPWNGCGAVLDANGQSAAFSPMTLLGLLVPPFSALSLWAALRLFLALLGVWLWLTELSVSNGSALFGSVAFGLSLTMTAWIFFPLSAAVCLWPWALFLLERLGEARPRRRPFAGLVLILTIWPLSGHLETIASAAAFTGVWLAARALAGDGPRVRRLLSASVPSLTLAFGFCAFSLLPQILAIRASNRLALVAQPFWTPILSVLPHGPGWKGGALALLFPSVFGDRTAIPMLPGAAGAFPEMAQGYIGIVTAALLLLFLRPGSPRPSAEKALVAPALFGVGAAIGLWPFAEAVSRMPGLWPMFPLRYLTWFALAGAALASFELDRLARDLEKGRSARLFATGALGSVLLLGYVVWRFRRGAYVAVDALVSAREAFVLGGIALAAALAVLMLTRGDASRLRAWGIPALGAIVAAELFLQGSRLYRWSEISGLYAPTPLVRFLQAQPRSFRVVAEGAMLFPNVGVLADVEDVRTHDATERREYVEFLDAAAGYEPAAYFKQIADFDAPALDFLNVRYLVLFPGRSAPSAKWQRVYSGADGVVFANRRARPRVDVPELLRTAPPAASRETWRSLDPSREALVEAALVPGDRRNGPAEISDYSERANAVAFRVRASEKEGAVLVASLANDGGWRARDDSGRRLPVGRANGPFLAVAVPAGDHRIFLAYAPPGFRAGVAISAATVAAGILFAAWRLRKTGNPA